MSNQELGVFDAIKVRRSVKHYKESEMMPEQEFQKLMSHVILSPTSYNIQHWRFVRVTDPSLREDIKKAAFNQEQVVSASELIVLCGNLNAWQEEPSRYVANSSKNIQDMLLGMMHSFYADKPQIQRDEVMRSVGISAQTLMLGAKAMGYDTSTMVGFDPEAVAELVNLPEGHIVVLLIAIGKAAKPAYSRGGQLPLSDVLVENRF